MCKGTKEENNICIFHCNPYNIWVGSVTRQGFGELFSCSWMTNCSCKSRVCWCHYTELSLTHLELPVDKRHFITKICAPHKDLWTIWRKKKYKYNSAANKLFMVSLWVIYAEKWRIKVTLNVLRFRKWKWLRNWPFINHLEPLSFFPSSTNSLR